MLSFGVTIFISLFFVGFISSQNATTPKTAMRMTTTKSPTKFQCYHGEPSSTSNIMPLMDCPSKICIMFVTVCQSYWATTCYNETHPMSFLNEFKNISKLSSPFYPSFSRCPNSGCNQFPLNATKLIDTSIIYKHPKSFDNLLWPNLGKEKQSNKFQNEITFGYANDFIFEFFGKMTAKTAKEIWIEYQVHNRSMDVLTKYRLTLNLLNSTVIGSISDNATKTSGKMELNQTFVSGQLINVTLISKGPYDLILLINGEKINYFLKNFDNFKYMRYGGDWTMVNATMPSDTWNHFSLGVYYPTSEPSFNKIHCDEEFLKTFQPNLKLNYTTFSPIGNSTTNQTIATINLAKILNGPNEAIEFELRDSLCPNNGVVRFQFESYENSTGVFYNYYRWQWWTLPPGWLTNAPIIINSTKCSQLTISMNNEGWYLSCQNNNGTILVDTAENKGKYTNLKYLVQGLKQSFNC